MNKMLAPRHGIDHMSLGVALLFVVLVGSGIGCRAPAPLQRSPEATPAARLAHHMERLEQWGFSGAVLVAQGDQILLEAGYGYSDPAAQVRIDAGTIFDIGSLAKQFTAAAVLLLQDRGTLSVHDTLGAFFPNVPRDKASITLHQILSHTSGLTREVGRDWEVTDRATFETRVLAAELRFPPGEGFSYSNAGYALLGAIVERVTGTPFHEFLDSAVIASAGLRRTGFIGRSPDPSHTALAASGARSGDNPADWPHTWNHRGSGGMVSTVGDFRRWRSALLAGQVISPAAVKAMHQPYVNGYGYGVRMSEAEFGPMYHHTGLWYSFTSRFSEFPDDSVLVVVLSNRRTGPYQPANVVARDLANDMLGTGGPSPPPLAGGASLSPELVGTYRTGSGGTVHVTLAEDHLRLDGVGQDVFDALFSDGTPTPAVLDLVRSRTASILLGVRAGDFDTLEIAAPTDRYERYKRLLPPIWAQREDSLGPLQRVDFVGIVDRGAALDVFATLRFADGSEGLVLTWSRDGVLLALANENPRMDGGLMTFRPTEDGGFAAYHFETRTVVRLRIDGARLRVLREDGTARLEAVRELED